MYDIKWKIFKSILDMECINFILYNEVFIFVREINGKNFFFCDIMDNRICVCIINFVNFLYM